MVKELTTEQSDLSAGLCIDKLLAAIFFNLLALLCSASEFHFLGRPPCLPHSL